jgi:hypothetical protein
MYIHGTSLNVAVFGRLLTVSSLNGVFQSAEIGIHTIITSSVYIYIDRAQDYPESKQIMAKLAGKNQHLRKINISEVGSLCCVKHRGNIMYREEST